MENYVSSQDAYRFLSRNPDVLLIDVRDPDEIAKTGLPEPADAIVPFRLQSTRFDHTLGQFALVNNARFLASMEAVLAAHGQTREDLIIVTCGSGRRASQAARYLFKNRYTNIWIIPDGYDGDTQPGMNAHNAWKLAGLPWIDPPDLGTEWARLMPY